LSDSVGLEDDGTIGGFKGGNFTQRELGDKVGSFIGDAHGELGDGKLQAIDVGSRLGLEGGKVSCPY
jgi:hypothetical protein